MAHSPEAHAGEAHAHTEEAFIWKYVFSKNHRIIGIQYYVTAMAMALVAGLLAMLIRLQLAWPQKDWGFLGKLFPMASGSCAPSSTPCCSRCTAPSWCSSCSPPLP
jgi:hypothetical protein